MNNHFDPDGAQPKEKGSISHEEYYYEAKGAGGNPAPATGGPHGAGSGSGAYAWLFIDLLLQRWKWLLFAGLVSGGLFFWLGTRIVKEKYTATGKLLRFQSPLAETFNLPQISSDTFSGLIQAPDLLDQVSKMGFQQYKIPALPPDRFLKIIKVDPQVDSDIVNVMLAARDRYQAVDLLNLYLTQTVDYTRKLQQQQAAVLADNYLKKQVQQMDKDITELQYQFRNIPARGISNQLAVVGSTLHSVSNSLDGTAKSPLLVVAQSRRLQTAIGELNDLLAKYTEKHPSVIAKEEEIQDLQKQLGTNAAAGTAGMMGGFLPLSPTGRPGDSQFNPELDIVRTKLLSLEQARVELANRQYQAELFATNAPGMAKVFAMATPEAVKTNMRWLKVGIVAIFGGFVGVGLSLFLVLLVEFVDNRLKTLEDVRRVTKLPVLTSLGNLYEMTPQDRSQWAFRTWTMLQGRLSPSANHGLVCGFTSSSGGEGRSTWISLLAEAASLTGFRVLTIATRPSPNHVPPGHQLADEVRPENSPKKSEDVPVKNGNNHSSALTTNVLTAPMQVTEKLTGPNSQPMVHIPLPGWVWNLERRKQWREALGHWRQIDNLVILVELPPSCVPEAVLLGANLPNMIWLTNSGTANAAETRVQLDTLRNARCNLVGAVLNREPALSMRSRFPRWFTCVALAGALGLSSGLAQQTNPPAAAAPAAAVREPTSAVNTNRFFSVVSPSQRADWQRHLTLGPGDVVNLGLFGHPELARADVAIAPDGRINYLEAQEVLAAGLTVDELRDHLDKQLGEYRRAARTVITPVAFRSKKYCLLGKVVAQGVYILDRPITVLEAIARARGVENGLVDRNVVDLADFQHSFVAREGKRIPLNFEKLFQQGDLSQNIAVEPGDYIYLAARDVQEVYVVGEVRLPGAVSFNPQMTIIRAITARGGFTDRAFRARVLVVRGSINNPETFAVNVHAVLDGKAKDFQLQPKDIIYVNSRPFIWVEEAADLATTAFIQSLITSWVGADVVKPIQ